MAADVTVALLVEEDNSDRMMLENVLLWVVVAHNEIVVAVAAVEELIHDWKEFRQYSEKRKRRCGNGKFYRRNEP